VTRRLERLLRWYPRAWRERYGEEFLALLDDELHGAASRPSFRAKVALSGLRERAHASGIVGASASAEARRRGGSLLVLVAWAGMIVGGAGLAKSAEHFSNAMPASLRAGAQLAYDVAVGAGVTGMLLVGFGALVAAPAFVRFVVSGGGPRIRRPVSRALVASAATAVAMAGLGAWAHHLTVLQRNGGDASYIGAFLAVVALIVVTIGLWTAAMVATVSAMEMSAKVLRFESTLAGAVSAAAVLLTAGTVAWWLEVGRHAPWFFRGGPGTAVSPWSMPMELNTTVMVLSLVLAAWGVSRIASARRLVRLETSTSN
jgi:hypothetical protein